MSDGSANPDRRRQRGAAKMREVYGFAVDPADVSGGYLEVTVDHLFGDVWTRPGLDIAERRLLTIGAIVAQGQHELLDIQFGAALDRGEMDEEQVREAVVHLAHYVGWPLSTGAQAAAERAIASHRRRPAPAADETGTDGGTR
jgi:4-carboxymuconolactone decarboxylase